MRKPRLFLGAFSFLCHSHKTCTLACDFNARCLRLLVDIDLRDEYASRVWNPAHTPPARG